MKKLILITCIIIGLYSCEKKNDSTPTPTSSPSANPLISIYTHYIWSGFYNTPLCDSGFPSSWSQSNNAEIFEQNGQYWIKNLFGNVNGTFPITPINNSSFIFNPYTITTATSMNITGGSGYLLNDTLTVSININTSNPPRYTNCNFTANGKYYK